MNDQSIMRISRSNEIKNDLDQAILWLYNLNFEAGNLIMVNYRTVDDKIDAVLALGLKTGKGKDSFKVISVTKDILIWGVYFNPDDIPDVSQLDHEEDSLYNDPNTKKWYIIHTENNVRTFIELSTIPRTFINLFDGTVWLSNEKKQVVRLNDLAGIGVNVIDDSGIFADRTWSSSKINSNFYNKGQVDSLIDNIDIIQDDQINPDKTWSSEKINPIYTWAKNKINQEIVDKFTIETSSTGGSYYIDTSTNTTMTVTVKTKFDGSLVDADKTPTGWDKISTGTYTKSITGSNGTSINAQEFEYTKDGILITKSSTKKSISATNVAYYGLIEGNDGTVELTSQIMSTLDNGRITHNINRTETINNNSTETRYLWILTKSTADATQFAISMFLDNITHNKSFESPRNSNITLTGYNLYISDKSVSAGGSYDDVNLIINI